MTVDAAIADRFLALLGNRLTFQTFDDSQAKRRELSRIVHGSLATQGRQLAELNERGAGIFVMVNEGDGKGRGTKHVTTVRAVFVDLDGAPLQPVQDSPLPAHCIVESSPNRWHAYWLVSDCTLQQFTPLQKALAARFAGDAKVCDLGRVMRLPGYMHRKGHPFQTRIVTLRAIAPYSVAELVEGLALHPPAETQPAPRRSLPDAIPEGERNAILLSLAGGLVRKGHSAKAVNDRLQRINAERCQPPLGADEVDEIAARASRYGSKGFTLLTDPLLDSPAWKSLPPHAHDVIVTALRRYDGSNNGNISLTWEDFKDLPGFARKHTFYEQRRLAVASGILLQVSEGRNTQGGKKPALFAIADRYLHVPPVSDLKPGASVGFVHPYIDRQDGGSMPLHGSLAGKRPASGRKNPKRAA